MSGCQGAAPLSNCRSSSHSNLGKPRRFDGLVLRRRLGPCSRPFALKLPIDRLPGSLWSSDSTIVTRLNSRFRWKVRNLLDQGDSTRIRLGDHRGVLPPVHAGGRPQPTPRKPPLSKAKPRSVSNLCGHRWIDDLSYRQHRESHSPGWLPVSAPPRSVPPSPCLANQLDLAVPLAVPDASPSARNAWNDGLR